MTRAGPAEQQNDPRGEQQPWGFLFDQSVTFRLRSRMWIQRTSHLAEFAVEEKSKRKRATFLEWCLMFGVALAALAILSDLIWRDWSTHGIPEWYQTYLRWQHRYGIDWLPF